MFAGAAARASAVPQGFIGMMADGPLFDPEVNLGEQLDQMVASGVESLRVTFNWSTAQPYASWRDVPLGQAADFTDGPGDIPTDFRATDQIVALAAQRQLPLLPVVVYAPPWDVSPEGSHVRPVRDAPFGNFLTALVERYGPDGSFWSTNPSIPRQPVTMWQVWNEPDISFYWSTANFAKGYVSLLRVAHDAIKRVDPAATVVLAGLTNDSWRDLEAIYKVRGARQLFDVVAADPYTLQPAGVITILSYVRHVMDRYGDRHKPILATEVGWPSALGRTRQNFGINTTERGQASKLRQLMPMLASDRQRLGLAGFYYYTWLSTDQRGDYSFDFSGLLGFNAKLDLIYAKPAYSTFRRIALTLELCRKKGRVPTSCLTPGQ